MCIGFCDETYKYLFQKEHPQNFPHYGKEKPTVEIRQKAQSTCTIYNTRVIMITPKFVKFSTEMNIMTLEEAQVEKERDVGGGSQYKFSRKLIMQSHLVKIHKNKS